MDTQNELKAQKTQKTQNIYRFNTLASIYKDEGPTINEPFLNNLRPKASGSANFAFFCMKINFSSFVALPASAFAAPAFVAFFRPSHRSSWVFCGSL
jgi:hypothetical protein